MAHDDLTTRSHQEGAFRRALAEGRARPEDAPPEGAPAFHATPPATPATPAPSERVRVAPSPAVVPETPQPLVKGPWFDARGFFLGWAGLVIGGVAFGSALAAVAIGGLSAYLFSRHHRVMNAVASVGIGLVGGFLLLMLLVVVLTFVR
jgi:hypothetical protein